MRDAPESPHLTQCTGRRCRPGGRNGAHRRRRSPRGHLRVTARRLRAGQSSGTVTAALAGKSAGILCVTPTGVAPSTLSIVVSPASSGDDTVPVNNTQASVEATLGRGGNGCPTSAFIVYTFERTSSSISLTSEAFSFVIG